MRIYSQIIKRSVAALCVMVTYSLPAVAKDEAELLKTLRDGDAAAAQIAERELITLWSKSGSASMDFLLKRGRDAMEVKDWKTAVEHLTALTDHAPEFAEGFYARAQAYYQQQLFGPAVADLEQVLALNPNHYAALRGMGSILETLGEANRAHAAYKMVLDLHPGDEEAQKGLERTERKAMGRSL